MMSRKPLSQWSRFIIAGVYYKECVKTSYCGIKRKLTSYTRDDFFIGMSKHQEQSWKYDAQCCIFDEIRGGWTADETRLSFIYLLII